MASGDQEFSVVIPTHNRPRQLAVCLRALAQQEYPRERFEVIVVDDGSSTPIGDVLTAFETRLALTLVTVPNAGPAAARNQGAAQARGRYLAFTDDDCAPTVAWLQALDARARTVPGAMLGGRTLNRIPEKLCSAASQLVLDAVYAHFNADPDRAQFFASNNLAVPADRFRALGGFDAAFRTAEDRDLCDRWLGGGGCLVYEPQAVVYHAHPLTLGGFWRQHVAYGRGAYRFHSTRNRWARFGIDGGFYRELGLRPFSRDEGRRAIRLTLLLAVQQAANAVGFLTEMLGQRWRGREAGRDIEARGEGRVPEG